jgi:hypothetical protein
MGIKSLLIVGMLGLAVLALSSQSLAATVTFDVGSPSYQNPDGSYNVQLATTPISATVADAAGTTVGWAIGSNPLFNYAHWAVVHSGAQLWENLPGGVVDFAAMFVSQGLPLGDYTIVCEVISGGVYVASERINVSLMGPVTVTYNVGSPNVQNSAPDFFSEDYIVASTTPISATISSPINPNTVVAWLIASTPGFGYSWGGVVWSAPAQLYKNIPGGTVDFSAGISTLPPGDYKLKVDVIGVVAETLNVVVDANGPVLVITHPQDGATLNSATLNVNGNATDDSGVASVVATINEVSLPIDALTGDFGGQVLHTLQPFTVTVTATDNIGNQTVKDLTVKMQHDRGLRIGQ